MNCSNCNAELLEGAKFCAICGARVQEAAAAEVFTSPAEASVIPEVIPASTVADPGLVSEPSAEFMDEDSNQTEELVRESIPEQAIPVSAASSSAIPAPKKEKKPLKIVLIAAAIVAVIAIVAVVVVLAMSGVFSPKRQAPKPYLLVRGEDEALVFFGNDDPTEIKGGVDSYQYSLDGKIMAIIIDTDDEGVGELVLCTGKDTIEVADEVYGFSLSDDGQKLAYFTDYDDEDYSATMNMFDLSTRKSQEIAENVMGEAGVVFSPDGKTISYVGDLKMNDDKKIESFMGYMSKNGEKAVEIGENKMVIALSNDATYIYYSESDPKSTDSESEIYVKKGETEEKLGKANMNTSIYFNQDCSEIMFTRNGSTYISVDGADKEKISGNELKSIVFPANTSISYNYFDSFVIVAAVPSLKDQILVLDDDGDVSVSYIDKNLELEEIDSLEGDAYSHDVSVSADGKSLVYIDDSSAAQLYKNFRNFDEKPVEIDPGKDLSSILPSNDFSKIYLVDEENTLFLQINSGEPIEVFEDVEDGYLDFSTDEARLYFMADVKTDDETYISSGNFYAVDATSGAKPEEMADEVSSFTVSEYGIVYYVYDKTDDDTYVNFYDAYFSRDGKKFKSVMDEAL